VLMASAYPIELVQAERWLEANKNLKGDRLKAEVDKQPWDDSSTPIKLVFRDLRPE
jgi:hypothetical protein